MSETIKQSGFVLQKELGYFKNHGVDVMAFDDFYPEGHQSGVSVIMHGSRVATNGDIRFEQTPGQWQPVPKQTDKIIDTDANAVEATLAYPDKSRHLQGFNPMIYPDFEFTYRVRVEGRGDDIFVTVDLDRPVPAHFLGKVCFNMELFPGYLFGKPWIMDDKSGIFPRQPNGPTLKKQSNLDHSADYPLPDIHADYDRLTAYGKAYSPMTADDLIAEPYAVGRRLTVQPNDPYRRLTVESCGKTELKLYDGRMNHNNGWFVISCEVPAGETRNAIQWKITPHVVPEWRYQPVIQISQVGYHPSQPKIAVIELDRADEASENAVLYRITEHGETPVMTKRGTTWGDFLRYSYLQFDFSDCTEEGLYQIGYADSRSDLFRIARDVYDRGVWQPVLEYFLPVQMCHMRVSEKYRVWHGLCHNDDARMAPTSLIHFDGYEQGPSTLTKYRPGEVVPGLNVGGWHDAGDFDLRIESQSGECYILSAAYEAFGVDYDATSINQQTKCTEIHQPDGKNDILQQIEHGVLSIVAGYRALGRLYRGIICSHIRQYVLLGDAAAMTDGIAGNDDDRWVFTEENPSRALSTAVHLAASARALAGFNDDLSAQALEIAKQIYADTDASKSLTEKLHAACELYMSTSDVVYKEFILAHADIITADIERYGWFVCKALDAIADDAFTARIGEALTTYKSELDQRSAETPYGVPYRPHIWGAGWNIQSLGFRYYFLYRAFPQIFAPDLLYNALNFVLGCHPGSNTASFASGVGTRSATTAYGLNRADWSYIPGGCVSGTGLIRPDFPELLEFPFLWQQTEYVLGGGSSHYMFLVLAAQKILGEEA